MYEKDFNNNTAFYQAISSCDGKGSCLLNYTSSWFKSGTENIVYGPGGEMKYKLYLKYHCMNVQISFFGKEFSKSDLNYVVIGINLAIIVIFIGYLISWYFYEKKIFKFFEDTRPLPSDYTIKLKNLPQNLTEEELKRGLYDHFNNFKAELKINSDLIVDINLAKTNDLIYLNNLINSCDNKIKSYINKMEKDNIIEHKESNVNLGQLIENLTRDPKITKSDTANSMFKRLVKTAHKKSKLEKRLEHVRNKKIDFQSAFITFNYNVNKVKFLNAMNISACKRFKLCCMPKTDHPNYFKGKILSAKNPSEPVNILWENLQVSPLEKRIRRVISWILSIVLIAIPILIVILISISIADAEPLKLSCPKNRIFSEENMSANPNIKQALIEDYRVNKATSLMFCYCYQNIRKRFYE